MMEELVINIISNAPAVVVLIYLVIRLDSRLEKLQDCMLDIVRERDRP